ncbi:MAG: sensor histidine kinase [Bryobacteraceae bacterium]
MSLPIRVRLTASYAALLLLILLVFGVTVDVAVRAAIHAGVDYDLQVRMSGVEAFMQKRIPHRAKALIPHEFQEHVSMRPGGEMMQVADDSRQMVFQSESIRGLRLPVPVPPNASGVTTEVLRGLPVRVMASLVTVQGNRYCVQLATTLGAFYLALDRFRELMFWLIPLMIAAASAGGYWLSGRALAPVGRIVEDARSISVQDMSRRLLVPATHDELQRLSETLNDLMARLELAFRRITRFTADASHELRAPIALIRGTAEVVLLQQRNGESYRAALRDILVEGERTSKLIEDLLMLARADSGASRLAMGPVDLREPLLEACVQPMARAQSKGVRLDPSVPETAAAVVGDRDALRRLFLILLDNAVKYTPPGGSVRIELAQSEREVRVTVRDTGIGIASEDLEHIFERFYRADKARQRDSGGAGLGLSIARWIADAHHAGIQVESALNRGSAFHVIFPRRP